MRSVLLALCSSAMIVAMLRASRASFGALVALASTFLATGTAHAHHSISGVYDSSRPVTVEGRVTEFRFVNPHPILVIEVPTSGALESWQLEMDNRFELAAIGMSAGTFAAGDLVVATGSLGRTEPRRLYLRRLDRPADGFRYEQIGSRPSTRTRGGE